MKKLNVPVFVILWFCRNEQHYYFYIKISLFFLLLNKAKIIRVKHYI